MALTADRNTVSRTGDVVNLPVAADEIIYKGALVALSATGYVMAGYTASTLIAIGRAEEYVDATGLADGVKTVTVSKGIFGFANSAATDNVTRANIGGLCYIVDDATVMKTASGKSAAGKVFDYDSVNNVVWVDMR